MKILGISAHYHDSAAALVVDGVPVCAVQEERLSRHKNDAAFPIGAIEWCLDHAGLGPADLDAVVFYERSMLKFERILTSRAARVSAVLAILSACDEELSRRKGLGARHHLVPSRHPARKILFTEHHESHAAAAFLTAPTRRAAILTADGVGEWATLTVGHGERRPDGGTDLTLLREIRYPHSLGMLYSTFTAYLGFEVNEDEYKVMGLAAYGRPTMMDRVRKLIRRTPDGAFALAPGVLRIPHHRGAVVFVAVHRAVRSAAPYPHEPIDLDTAEGRRFADCAASMQRVLEDTLVDIARALRQETRPAGSVSRRRRCAQRCRQRANPRGVGIRARVRAAGARRRRLRTGGGAVCRSDVLPQPGSRRARSSVLGSAGRCARSWRGRRGRMGRHVEELDDAPLIERVADELAAGRIVGWMDGACEFGPRALGHRSILAAPHAREMRDRLNRDIKYREEFRPFAPVVPIDAAERYFELPPGGARLARFMSGVFPVRPEWRISSARSRTSTGRPACRCSNARWRRACTPCSRRTAGAAACRSC